LGIVGHTLSPLFYSREKRSDNIRRTVLKGLNSHISLLRNKRLMRKESIFKVINIGFIYGIPIRSRRIVHFPRYSDYRIQLSKIVRSDIRQLPVGFLSEVVGLFGVSCRIRRDRSLGFRVLGHFDTQSVVGNFALSSQWERETYENKIKFFCFLNGWIWISAFQLRFNSMFV
jgi:hypothetical protein